MPYISQIAREQLQHGVEPVKPGELNYILTMVVDEYIQEKGGVSYTTVNEVIGVLECAKLELYRRVLAPYEDKKRDENGEVYTI